MKVLNLGIYPLPAFGPKDFDLHNIVQAVQCECVHTLVVCTKEQCPSLDQRMFESPRTRREEAEHGLSFVAFVLAATPTHNYLPIDVQLEVVQCVWWMRCRYVVAEPELRGWIHRKIDGNNRVVSNERWYILEGIGGFLGWLIFWNHEYIKL